MISLKEYNSFGVEAYATELLFIKKEADLFLADLNKAYKILGGGTNVLITQNLNCAVLKNELKGIQILDENSDSVTIRAASGENWHEFVSWTVNHHYGGIENLSLIPGSVGAAPVQNIGAYGVELKDVIEEVEGYFLPELRKYSFKKEECDFAYRSSIFKNKLGSNYFITSIVVKLKKKPQLNLSYAALSEKLKQENILNPTIADVSRTIIEIRNSKLPDPKVLGNAGSFFKNPNIALLRYNSLKQQFPELPYYPEGKDSVKIPAGWLIERCGWKGFRKGDTGCYEKQALVLVNYNQATGSEILHFANEIMKSVKDKFDILLVPEVNIW